MGKKIKIKSNLKELDKLLKDFYTVTKVKLVVYDDNFQKILSYPMGYSPYCDIIRQDPIAKANCRQCDLNGCLTCKKTKRRYIYECHAGLYEAVTPLMAGDMLIGYLMLGQLLVDDGLNRRKKWEKLYEKVKNYDIDFQALENSYWNRQKVTEETVLALSKIMETCASYLYLTETIAVGAEALPKQIEDYIVQNLEKGDEITPEKLCDEFGIRRTKLYEVAKHSFGMGISEYIRKLRMKKACDLLKNSKDKISDIAEMVGIPDYNYFTKVFKKNIGMTPSEYRKINQKS